MEMTIEVAEKGWEKRTTKQAVSPKADSNTPKRLCGFQRPFSRDQIISWIVEVVTISLYYIVSFWFLSKGEIFFSSPNHIISIFIIVHLLFIYLVLINWISCETIDPASKVSKDWFGINLVGERWTKTRYCAICRKVVIGMDHHCSWLHTCIGSRNYIQFFILTVSGSIQFALQTFLCLYFLLLNTSEINLRFISDKTVFLSLVIICLTISIVVLVAHVMLLMFHLYLLLKGYGTYDFILKRRELNNLQDMPPKANEGDINNTMFL